MAQTVVEPPSTADALRAEMAPSGLLQTFLVGQIARAMDRLDLAAAREDRDEPASLRDQVAAERSFYRAMAEFRRLAKAASKAGPTLYEAKPTPPVASGHPAPKARQTLDTEPMVDDLLALRADGEPRFRALASPDSWMAGSPALAAGRDAQGFPEGRRRPRNPPRLVHSRPIR